eukprot:TRINITY_DN1557_c1_g1_i1.p1 TRINITY_DN1557_c1_g1~~TRINITY_DN1557_c1_g1_i1.p1  ORF type:complete len:659 (-),score=169.88 TRINITY_DN1557_c1_g1_i1:425-2401(-)
METNESDPSPDLFVKEYEIPLPGKNEVTHIQYFCNTENEPVYFPDRTLSILFNVNLSTLRGRFNRMTKKYEGQRLLISEKSKTRLSCLHFVNWKEGSEGSGSSSNNNNNNNNQTELAVDRSVFDIVSDSDVGIVRNSGSTKLDFTLVNDDLENSSYVNIPSPPNSTYNTNNNNSNNNNNSSNQTQNTNPIKKSNDFVLGGSGINNNKGGRTTPLHGLVALNHISLVNVALAEWIAFSFERLGTSISAIEDNFTRVDLQYTRTNNTLTLLQKPIKTEKDPARLQAPPSNVTNIKPPSQNGSSNNNTLSNNNNNNSNTFSTNNNNNTQHPVNAQYSPTHIITQSYPFPYPASPLDPYPTRLNMPQYSLHHLSSREAQYPQINPALQYSFYQSPQYLDNNNMMSPVVHDIYGQSSYRGSTMTGSSPHSSSGVNSPNSPINMNPNTQSPFTVQGILQQQQQQSPHAFQTQSPPSYSNTGFSPRPSQNTNPPNSYPPQFNQPAQQQVSPSAQQSQGKPFLPRAEFYSRLDMPGEHGDSSSRDIVMDSLENAENWSTTNYTNADSQNKKHPTSPTSAQNPPPSKVPRTPYNYQPYFSSPFVFFPNQNQPSQTQPSSSQNQSASSSVSQNFVPSSVFDHPLDSSSNPNSANGSGKGEQKNKQGRR